MNRMIESYDDAILIPQVKTEPHASHTATVGLILTCNHKTSRMSHVIV